MSQQKLIQVICKELFEAEGRRLDQAVAKLNSQNKKLHESGTDGFMYGGTFFLPKDTSVMIATTGQAKPVLHRDLYPAIKDHLRDVSIVQDEQRYIQQTLFRLLMPCQTTQDIRDALPECVVSCLPDLNKLHRLREPAYTLQGDARALRQYEKILPKMELYSATRLLY